MRKKTAMVMRSLISKNPASAKRRSRELQASPVASLQHKQFAGVVQVGNDKDEKEE
jgi:hypothetical protein